MIEYSGAIWRGLCGGWGFCEEWINLVMMCVKSASFSVLVNDHLEGRVILSRGLRQGDPLSLFIFVVHGGFFGYYSSGF